MGRPGSLTATLLGMLVFAVWSPAQAHGYPYYGAGGAQYSTAYGYPGAPKGGTSRSSRPASVHFYTLGARAFRNQDYTAAMDRFTVAARYASEPAEYSLGVMHFRGVGVTSDRALGAAWMRLAAERGNPEYVKARDAIVGLLTDAEAAKADMLYVRLQEKYGDKVALRRN